MYFPLGYMKLRMLALEHLLSAVKRILYQFFPFNCITAWSIASAVLLIMHFFIQTHPAWISQLETSCSQWRARFQLLLTCSVLLFFFLQKAIFALAAGRSVNAVMSMAFSVADGMLLFQRESLCHAVKHQAHGQRQMFSSCCSLK